MSPKPIRINIIEKYPKDLNVKAYKETGKETLMSRNLYLKGQYQIDTGANSNRIKISRWKRFKMKFLNVIKVFLKRGSNIETQLDLFQSSIKYCLVGGQCLGIFPLTNTTDINLEEKRFKLFSWRYLLCFIACFGQIIGLALNFYNFTLRSIDILSFSYFSFFLANCSTSFLFMRLGTKWHDLMEQVVASDLNEYLDLNVHFKCKFTTIIILTLAIVEHLLSRIFKWSEITDCSTDDSNLYEKFMISSFRWVFDVVPYSFPVGVYVLILNTVASITWSYPHIFIICVSLYLTSILQQLNKKIISKDGQHLPASYWRKLREDYNRATRLVRSFDDAINSIVFISFASNLYFVCLQLFYLLARCVESLRNVPLIECPNYPSGLFNGYEYTIYVSFSLIFVLSRCLAVSITAADVHSASLVAAPSLYNVPSSSYGTEIQRFLEQVHGDTVALTGLNFFYVTKELVLSMVGTIVTYELVLLQFNQ